ncbi:MAG: DNA translocase FtsK, partial [Treponema sp.]|nr:DNA translocase FtsK [Treponema sp.]
MSNFKYRVIALSSAVLLGLCSLVLSAAILGAIMGLPGFGGGPGAFLAACYGLLALGIPAFLFYAALILADKAWRPDRIFLLAVSLFPFMTLATGVVFVRDYEIRVSQYFFLELAGKTGFSFTIAALTVLEVLAITVLKLLLFPRNVLSKALPRTPADSLRLKFPFPGRGDSLVKPAPEEKDPQAVSAGTAGPESAKVGAAETGAAGTEQAEAAGTAAAPAVGTPVAETVGTAEAETTGPANVEIPGETSLPDPETEAPGRNENAAGQEFPPAPHTPDAPVVVEVVSVKPRPVPKTKIRGSWKVPVDILNHYPDGEYWIIDEATRAAAVTLRATLEEFHIQAEVTGIRKGPVITMFEILPAPGVKLSKIVNLQDNIALRLAASSVRIVAPIPGKHAVGIEVPNARRNIVSFREIIEGELHREGKKEGQIPVVLGKDITGEAQTVDLAQMPHLLIAGATGSGKSVCVNSMILSILYQKAPAECRLILIDPKIVELKLYNDIPHLLTPVITEPKRAFQALQYLICEMERRYACLDSMGV